MKIQVVKFFIVMCYLVSLSGCARLEHLSSPRSSHTRTDNQELAVNAYYLFAEAHLRLKKGNVDQAIELAQQALEQDPDSVYLKRELAGIWLMKKDTGTATKLLDEILAEHPDDVETLILTGRIKQNVNQKNKAIDSFSRVIDLDPFQQDIYLRLGNLYMEQEQWEEAKSVYEQLVRYYPGSYPGYFFLGRISAMAGDRKAALAYFEKTLALEPELMESRFEMGALYEADKNYDKASAIYGDILAQHPTNIQATMALGYLYHQIGSGKKAAHTLEVLGQRSVTDQDIIRTVVREYLDTKNYRAGSIIVDGMINGAPNNTDLKYLLGVALDGIGKKRAAIENFKQVDPESRFFQNAAVHAALLYQEMEQIPLAIDFLLETIEKAPENTEFRLYLGSFYEQIREYEKAEKALNEGLSIAPENPRLFFRLGVVYDKWGKKDASISAMKQVTRLDPDNASALNYLGYSYADMGTNLDEAERLILKALEIKPEDGYITDSLAWVYYKKGKFKKALVLLEKAARLVPDDPIVQEHLGDVYSKLGMTQKALESYRRSIKNKNEDKPAVELKIRQLTP